VAVRRHRPQQRRCSCLAHCVDIDSSGNQSVDLGYFAPPGSVGQRPYSTIIKDF
jgi:hypothetical protein